MKNNRNLWPLGIITAFVLFFSGIAFVIYITATHAETLVSDSYYDQEVNFQTQIDGAVRAQKAGASISRDAASGDVVITVPASHLSQKLSGTIEFYRPSDPRLDRQFKLQPKADGTQMLDVSKLAAGPWRIRAQWNAGGENYFLQERITVMGK